MGSRGGGFWEEGGARDQPPSTGRISVGADLGKALAEEVL